MIDDEDFFGDAEENNIIACFEEGPAGTPPRTIAGTGSDRIVARTILEWNPHSGTYGTVGPGFYGFRLQASTRFPEEWLVLRLWGAGGWLLMDNAWVESPLDQYNIQRPLISSWADRDGWDDFSAKVLGSNIKSADIQQSSSRLDLQKGSEEHTLEVPKDTIQLLFYPQAGARRWNPKENQLEARVVTEGLLWCD